MSQKSWTQFSDSNNNVFIIIRNDLKYMGWVCISYMQHTSFYIRDLNIYVIPGIQRGSQNQSLTDTEDLIVLIIFIASFRTL